MGIIASLVYIVQYPNCQASLLYIDAMLTVILKYLLLKMEFNIIILQRQLSRQFPMHSCMLESKCASRLRVYARMWLSLLLTFFWFPIISFIFFEELSHCFAKCFLFPGFMSECKVVFTFHWKSQKSYNEVTVIHLAALTIHECSWIFFQNQLSVFPYRK